MDKKNQANEGADITTIHWENNDPVLIALIHAAVSILTTEDRGNLRDEKVAASRLLRAKFKEFTPETGSEK